MSLFEGRGVRIRGIMLAIILTLSILLMSSICTPIYAYSGTDQGTELFVLMYHNVVPNSTKASKYEIRECDLERDLRYIESMGIDVVTPSDIYAYQAGKRDIGRRSVMLTFDDGYYSYIKYLLPLLDRYNMRAVVNVVGEYTRYGKSNKDTTPRYRYLEYEDILALRDSGRVEIGLHSYALHHIVNGVNGAGQRKGESDADYRVRLLADTNKLVNSLGKIGIRSDIYAYPYGNYSRCSDRILSEAGVRMTLSCNERVNHLTRTSKLTLLGRYNRDGRVSSLRDMHKFFAR